MKASVMLEKSSDYRILDVNNEKGEETDRKSKVLVLRKVTETGAPFIVVVGYFLGEAGDYDESILAEIETMSISEYEDVKTVIRSKLKSNKTPITFW